MKISTKLALGFGSLIVFIAIISFLSLSNMSKLNNSVQELANDRFPKVVWSNNIIDAINDAARAMRMLVILNTEEYAAESTNNRKRIEDAATKASQNIDSLKATIFSDEAKALLNKLETSRQNYYNARQGFLSLIDQKRFAEAGVYLAKDLRQPQQEYFDSIQELINFFGNQFKDDAMQAQSTYSASFNLILILVIVAILIAIVLSVYIIRNITKSIQQGVNAAEAISHGDMNTNIDASSKDEVGILMSAMKAMSENIQSIISEVNKSAKMAQDGKLDYRANANAFEGEYKQLLVSFNETLDALIKPINVTAEYVDRISKGDIPPKITEEYKGDFNEIKNNLNGTIDSISALVNDAKGLAEEAKAGRIRSRADISRHLGDFRNIVAGFNGAFDAIVSIMDNLPIPVMGIGKDFEILYMNKIGSALKNKSSKEVEGGKCYNHFITDHCNTANCACDLAMKQKTKITMETIARPLGQDINIRYTGVPILNEKGEVVAAYESVVDESSIKKAMARAEKINKYQANEVSNLIVNLGKIAEGDLALHLQTAVADEDTQANKSDFDQINNALNTTKTAIQQMYDDARKVSTAAEEGRLDFRADAGKHSGAYNNIIVGFNKTLDNVIGPLNVAAEYVDRISKGDIPPKITEEYKGDFNEIKNNLNATIDVMSGLLQDTNGLIKASIDGKLDTRANASKYIGGWNELVAGINELINALVKPINVTAEYVDRISKGDIPPKITEEYKGDFNEIKNNLNGTIDVMNSLTGEIQSLIENTLNGNLSFRANNKVFIGSWSELVGGINELLDNIVDPINEASHAVSILATGDLRIRMEGNYKGDLAKLKNDINTLADSLSALINEVNNTVEQVASAATQMSATSDTLAAGTQEQSAQTDDVASAVEEMSRTITENAMGATRTSEVAHKNGDLANQGGVVVQQTVQKMTDIAKVVGDSVVTIQKLGESSKQIGEIISVIDDIADQTNLLALNAAIEAARAGEQGRGFAVVADEVRKLAERTTDATKQIANMIRGIQKETDMAVVAMNQGNDEVKKGIELADRAGQSLGDILSSTKELLEMINQIAAASEEQSATSEEISKNVISISKVIAESSRRVEDVAHASDDMAKLTERLRNLMMQFKIDGGGAFSAPSSPKNYSLSSSSASKRQLQTSSAAVAPSYNAPSETGSVWD